ncbi:FAD binding domain-containing protein [Colletotrichum kahawae]|uniref:FAD binding domain-containing protein n=1 Tax=Colletotrichum kahawae TaxID=34407 RepID=A0AAE0D7Z4_COLKA|nr:FAD binding domain-containing protein [Colletotrichum kahawae]
MQLLWFLVASAAMAASASKDPQTEKAGKVCQSLKTAFANSTILAGDEGYTAEIQVPWSARSWLGPACIFAPMDANELSSGLRCIVEQEVQFSMRGGGHMPISNASSIDADGILISSLNMKTLTISEDKDTVAIGPGLRWSDVYAALDGTGVTVLGGRGSPIGVSGLLLGGGVSFFSYEYGLASTNGNVKAYECVLADGAVVEATSTNEYADLFWALQGGGNSFCLVTRFDLQTQHSPSVMIASPSYGGEEVKHQFIDGVYNFAVNGHEDPKAAVLPVITYVGGTNEPTYSATLFYNGNSTSPAVLGDFLGNILTPDNTSKSLSQFPMGEYHQAILPSFQKGGRSYGSRQRFHMLPTYANKEAMLIAHDMYFELAKSTWTNEADDEVFDTFISKFNTKVRERLEPMGVLYPFYYLNEADIGQPVFESYPDGNLDRLKEIRAKFDPDRVFTVAAPDHRCPRAFFQPPARQPT